MKNKTKKNEAIFFFCNRCQWERDLTYTNALTDSPSIEMGEYNSLESKVI